MLANWYWLIPVFLLTFVNWGLEALKWKMGLEDVYGMSYKESWQSVIWGNMFSFITPNRAGSFLGRIILLPQRLRVVAIFRSFVINFYQLLITLVLGLVAMVFHPIPSKVWADLNWKSFHWIWILLVCSFLLIALAFMLLNNQKIGRFYFQLQKNIRRTLASGFIKKTPILITLSLLRYLVFVVQYLLLITFLFQVPVEMAWVTGIVLSFFIIAIFPISVFSNIGVREQVFIWVFAPWLDARIASICLIIWILNVLVPVLMGMWSYGRWKR